MRVDGRRTGADGYQGGINKSKFGKSGLENKGKGPNDGRIIKKSRSNPSTGYLSGCVETKGILKMAK